MKKIINVIFLLTLSICLITGCGKKKTEEPKVEEPIIKDDIKVNNNENLLKDQEVENFKFTKTSLVYDNGTSTLEVFVTNTGTEIENLSYIKIHIMKDDVELAELFGDTGSSIEPNGTELISSSYGDDITDATAIVYEIVR